ncbi:hypothetical protein BU16DRAFT_541897 [Lophium mytilinum]|uniref:Uncharacterized protein n=1 Tax=Lophium mytilinum TaxID=390894 RepID=A0A6A6QIB0_9PEZI|nr:hypothetical protein BU16DRAFT_541897 [Lophium mytilinum]
MAPPRGAIKWPPNIHDHSLELTREFDRLCNKPSTQTKQTISYAELLEFGAGVQRLHEKLMDSSIVPIRQTAQADMNYTGQRTENGSTQYPYITQPSRGVPSPYTNSTPPVQRRGSGYTPSAFAQQPASGQVDGTINRVSMNGTTLAHSSAGNAPAKEEPQVPIYGVPSTTTHASSASYIQRMGQASGAAQPSSSQELASRSGISPVAHSTLFSGFSPATQDMLKNAGVDLSSRAPRGVPPVAPADRASFIENLSPSTSTKEIIDRASRAQIGLRLQPAITATANNFQTPGTFPSRPDSRPMQYRVADQRLEQPGAMQSARSSFTPPASLAFGQPVPSTSERAVPSPYVQNGTQQPITRPEMQSTMQPEKGSENHPVRDAEHSIQQPGSQTESRPATQPEQRPEIASQQQPDRQSEVRPSRQQEAIPGVQTTAQPKPSSSTQPFLQRNTAASNQNAMVRTFSFGSVSTLTDQEETPEPISPEDGPVDPTHPMPIQEFQPDPEDVQSEPEVQQVPRRVRQKSKPELKGIQEARRQSTRTTSNTPSTYNLKLLAGTALHTPTKYLAKHIPNVTRKPKATPSTLTATPDTSLSLAESRISSRSTSRQTSTKGKAAAPRAAAPVSSRPRRRVRGPTKVGGMEAGERVLMAFNEAQARMKIKGSTRLERIIIAMNNDDAVKRNGMAQLTPPESISGSKGTTPQDAIAIDSSPSVQSDGETSNNGRKRKWSSSLGSGVEEVEVQQSTANSGRIELGSPQDSTEENALHWANRAERAGGRFVPKDKEAVPKKKRNRFQARSSTAASDAPVTPTAFAAFVAPKTTSNKRTRSSAFGAEVPATPPAPAASKAAASTRTRSSVAGSKASATPKVSPNSGTADQQVTSRGRTVRASTKVKQNLEMRDRGVVDDDD